MTPKLNEILVRLEATAGEYANISRENGQFLNFLVRLTGSRSILEIGTSNGYSTLWFAEALYQTAGQIDAIDIDAERQKLAAANIAEAGFDELVSLRLGNALELIPSLTSRYDFAFLDADKPQYLQYARLVLPKLKIGGLMIGDDTASLAHHMQDYLDFVHTTPDLHTIDLSLDDGLTISIKKH